MLRDTFILWTFVRFLFATTWMLGTLGIWSAVIPNRIDSLPERLSYSDYIFESNGTPSCPVYYNDDEFLSGVVTSPGYPSKYLPNTECTALLESPEGYYFELTIDDVSIEHDETCLFDYVSIKDGTTLDDPTLALICGPNAVEDTIKSSSNVVLIQFVSDGYLELNGFRIVYQAVPHEVNYEIENGIDDENEESEKIEVELEEEDSDYDGNDAEWIIDASQHVNVIIKRPENATVMEGHPHLIDCLVNVSNSLIVWLKDQIFVPKFGDILSDYILLPNNSVFIPSMNEYTKGLYTCVVLSDYAPLTLNAWITLQPSPDALEEAGCTLKIYEGPMDMTLSEGENASIPCYTNVNASITWLKDGDAMEVLEDYADRIELQENVLIINAVATSDSGLYACLAVDENGCHKVAEAELRVNRHENFTESCGQSRLRKSKLNEQFARVVAGRTADKGAFPWQITFVELGVT